MAKEFTDANFESEVLQSDKVVVVDLWAEWCGPCKMMSPIIDELATEYEGKAVIGKLDIDSNGETPMAYGVRGIPTFLIFKNGKMVGKQAGAMPKNKLASLIDSHL